MNFVCQNASQKDDWATQSYFVTFSPFSKDYTENIDVNFDMGVSGWYQGQYGIKGHVIIYIYFIVTSRY